MINPINTAQIFATLGSSTSLIPLGIKDVANTVGLTTGAYITGNKIEGKDRFIDEFGTQVIWLLGIPFFKKVIDKTVYKLAKFNPDIDSRILKNKDIFEKAKKHALPEIKESFERVEKKQKLFKGFAVGKFIAATALTMASYSALTTFRHKHTEKAIIEEIKKEEKAKKEAAFKGSQQNAQNKKQPSFGINMDPLKQFMFNPVKNTMIIDGGITAERLAGSRNPQDFMGYVIKEGGFWAFMYFAGPAIQTYLEKKAAKGGKPIDLDIRVLQDDEFKNAIKNKTIEKDLTAFSVKGTDAEIYEYLFDNSDNLIVKMAKKSEIIKTAKNSEAIDTKHYIDIEEIKGIKAKIENLYQKAHASENMDDFFSKIIKLKKASIIKNIGYSIGALGVLVPGIMVAMRYFGKDNKEFQVKKQLHKKLIENNQI